MFNFWYFCSIELIPLAALCVSSWWFAFRWLLQGALCRARRWLGHQGGRPRRWTPKASSSITAGSPQEKLTQWILALCQKPYVWLHRRLATLYIKAKYRLHLTSIIPWKLQLWLFFFVCLFVSDLGWTAHHQPADVKHSETKGSHNLGGGLGRLVDPFQPALPETDPGANQAKDQTGGKPETETSVLIMLLCLCCHHRCLFIIIIIFDS